MEKITITCFLPSKLIFITTHFILNIFFSKNTPIAYETKRTEYGVKSDFNDSHLPVCSPIALLVNSNLCKQCIQRIAALQLMYFTIFITSKIEYKGF